MLSLACVTGLAIIIYLSWRRVRRAYVQATSDLILSEALLRNELNEFRNGWEISASDISLGEMVDVSCVFFIIAQSDNFIFFISPTHSVESTVSCDSRVHPARFISEHGML